MPDVFEYRDFRRYLRDYYAVRKAQSPAFSYENFARKAGLKSKGMLHDILSGKRRLTRKSLFKLADACGLEGEALSFFVTLVSYGQAGTPKERGWILSRLEALRTGPLRPEPCIHGGREPAGILLSLPISVSMVEVSPPS